MISEYSLPQGFCDCGLPLKANTVQRIPDD